MHYLTANERLLIEIERRQTRHKKEHVRLSVLIMLDEGFNNETIALSQGIDADTISKENENMSRYPEIWTVTWPTTM
jgi:hypothetical protein